LAKLTGLTTIHVTRTKVTDAGVKQLQQALPHCTIVSKVAEAEAGK
jgi:hypothetical protein